MKYRTTKRRNNRRMGVFFAVLNGLNILFQILLKAESLVKHLKQ
jgi:hypothetical protein